MNKKTPREVVELAQNHGLELVQDSLVFNESGLDFLVVMATDSAGEDWILRLPRREDVLASVAQEKRTLDLVAPVLSIEVPVWVVTSSELIAYKKLTGVPAATIDPEVKSYRWAIDETNVPDQFHETLGRGIASIHEVDIVKAREAGLSVTRGEALRATMKSRMQFVRNEFDIGEGLWERWQRWLQNDALWPEEATLTHGELHAGHILVNSRTQVTGFIDWTEAAVMDPAVDFVASYLTFGEDALRKQISAYAQAGGHVWPAMEDQVIERAASGPLDIAEFALRSGLEEYRQMARKSLRPENS